MNENYIEEMENEGEALNQSLALNKVIINLLKQQRETNKRMFIALIVSILVNLAIERANAITLYSEKGFSFYW